MMRYQLAPAEQRRYAEWPRSAGKSRAFGRPPNEAGGVCPLQAPQATFSQ